jgi:hypothetical protein
MVKTATVWRHFEDHDGNASCLLCQEQGKSTILTGWIASNGRKHVKSAHSIEFKVIEAEENAAETSSNTPSKKRKLDNQPMITSHFLPPTDDRYF